MFLFDAHCHLQDERFSDRLPMIISRACSAGVGRMSCCGSAEQDWEAVRKTALAYEPVLPSFGLYPLNVARRSGKWLEQLKSFLLSIPSGVGEIGLDNSIEPGNSAEQEEVFIAQLRLARELRRPVTIHCRKAWGRLLEILKQEDGVKFGGMLHTYSGSPEMVRPFEEMGLNISFSGAITRPGNKRGCESLRAVTEERLLLETDSPDLTPVGAGSGYNEPANLEIIARVAAGLLNQPVETVAGLTFNNAHRLFYEVISKPYKARTR